MRTFIRLVPPGTLRLAPGMPAAVMVRGILTFAFFGADAYVSLTFQDVRDQPTWVAGVALTGATLGWTAAAWIQQRWILTAGPRRVVATGFVFLAVGIAGMIGAVGDLPIPVCIAAWSMAGFGIGLAYSPLSVTVLGLAEPGTEGTASSSIQLADVLGVALGAGLGGAFVALGDSQGWATSTALAIAFPITLAAAVDRHLRRPPPPHDAARLTRQRLQLGCEARRSCRTSHPSSRLGMNSRVKSRTSAAFHPRVAEWDALDVRRSCLRRRRRGACRSRWGRGPCAPWRRRRRGGRCHLPRARSTWGDPP